MIAWFSHRESVSGLNFVYQYFLNLFSSFLSLCITLLTLLTLAYISLFCNNVQFTIQICILKNLKGIQVTILNTILFIKNISTCSMWHSYHSEMVLTPDACIDFPSMTSLMKHSGQKSCCRSTPTVRQKIGFM